MVTIRDILRNHSYIGTYHRFGLRIPASHQPIVGADEFKQVQDRMHSRTPRPPTPEGRPVSPLRHPVLRAMRPANDGGYPPPDLAP